MWPLIDFHKKNVLTGLMFLVFLGSLLYIDWGPELIHAGGGTSLWQMVKGMFTPDLSGDILLLALVASWQTLVYAVAGMTLAIIFAFGFGTLASGVLAQGSLGRSGLKTFFRGVLGFMRAIHELVWAWLFVAAFGLTPFAAVFAIAIPYGGILGRIFADMLSDVPPQPIRALQAAGASRLQLLIYGYLPLAAADMTSYTMYRFECAIRSSAIMSFVGLGGLGYQIDLSLHDLKYSEVWTFLYFLIGLVIVVDLWSQVIRKRLVA